MNNKLSRLIALCPALFICLSFAALEAGDAVPRLSFNAEGELKILQVTDIHWKDGGEKDMKSLSLLRKLVDSEKPDVVVFTGDIVYGKKCPRPKEALDLIAAVPIGRGIPWSFTPGNHEVHGPLDKKAIIAYLRAKPFCLMNGADMGPDGISHRITVFGAGRGGAAASIFLFDSTGDGARSDTYITADISPAQVAWYEASGAGLGAVSFTHKPTAEFFDTGAFRSLGGKLRLVLPYDSSPSPLVRAFARQGTMRALFCGHLHVNDLLLDAGGVTLGFTRTAGYNAFCLPWVARGARVVLLTGSGSGFRTWEVTE